MHFMLALDNYISVEKQLFDGVLCASISWVDLGLPLGEGIPFQ